MHTYTHTRFDDVLPALLPPQHTSEIFGEGKELPTTKRNRNSPDETRRQDRGVVDPAIRAPHVQVLVGEYPIDGNGRGVQDVIDLEYQT